MSVSRAKQGSLSQTLALHMLRNFFEIKGEIWLVWRVISLLILFYFLPSENEEQKTLYNIHYKHNRGHEPVSLSLTHDMQTWILKRIFCEQRALEVLKSRHLRVMDALKLCSYKLWFKSLEASIWTTKIQNDRNLQNFIALHLMKFTFTSCQFEMLNKS